MGKLIPRFQIFLLLLLASALTRSSHGLGRVSEPILDNSIEHDGFTGGGTYVPSGLVGSVDVAMTDLPAPPLDPDDFRRGQQQQPASPSATTEDPTMTAGLFQGDIVIPDIPTLHFINSHIVNSKLKLTTKNAITKPYNKWPNAEIPYAISSRFNSNERAIIAGAISKFHQDTCIRFVPRNRQADYIYITGGAGCSSAVGRTGGQQIVTLGTGCVYDGIVMHELMHVAGFWHEQSRADRDNFIRIIYNNIQSGMAYNFDKYEWGFIQNLSVSYDTKSIMHYGSHAFAIDRSKPTIVALDGTHIGQRERFSSKDIRKLNALYSCGGGSTGGGGGTTEATTTTEAPIGTCVCEDKNENCGYWSSKGECEKNPDWMHHNCMFSCKQCEPGVCEDKNQHCRYWSSIGECKNNPDWMHQNCMLSCYKYELEKECKNKNVNCQTWANEGHCQISEAYMSRYCEQACGLCNSKSEVQK